MPGVEKEYRNFIEAGEWRIQRSPSTGLHVFAPREGVPGSGETDLEWVEPSGLGTVYSFSICNRKPEAGGPYNVALIDLDEGVRLMSRIEGVDNDAIEIGMRVKGRIGQIDGVNAVVFDKLEG